MYDSCGKINYQLCSVHHVWKAGDLEVWSQSGNVGRCVGRCVIICVMKIRCRRTATVDLRMIKNMMKTSAPSASRLATFSLFSSVGCRQRFYFNFIDYKYQNPSVNNRTRAFHFQSLVAFIVNAGHIAETIITSINYMYSISRLSKSVLVNHDF